MTATARQIQVKKPNGARGNLTRYSIRCDRPGCGMTWLDPLTGRVGDARSRARAAGWTSAYIKAGPGKGARRVPRDICPACKESTRAA